MGGGRLNKRVDRLADLSLRHFGRMIRSRRARQPPRAKLSSLPPNSLSKQATPRSFVSVRDQRAPGHPEIHSTAKMTQT